MFPERYVNLEAARRQFGERVDRLGAMLNEGDPLADEAVAVLSRLAPPERERLIDQMVAGTLPSSAPEPAARLCEHLHHVPFWVDYERCDRGGAAFVRTGPVGLFMLGFRSLVLGYCSPAGNKPLTFSGRLERAAPRRLNETGRFVERVSMAGGMRPGAPGFAAAARVRLMHAQVRRLCASSPRWNFQAWGLPVNQLDMTGTVLLFSLAVLEGLERLGMPLGQEAAEELLHLWRYTGYVLGVREELLCATRQEARLLWEVITSTQAPPDEDSAALAEALVQIPRTEARTPQEHARARHAVAFAYALSRYLIGDERADALRYPKSTWTLLPPLLRPLLSGASHFLRRVPGSDALALQLGMAYWRRAISVGLGGVDATFELPQAMTR